jgi:FHS family Na+ dependent glucose MFS transporter 1
MTSASATPSSAQSAFSFERLWRVLPYCASYSLSGLLIGTFGPTLSHLSGQTGSTLGQISGIFAAISVGYILGALLSGRLYDRLPGPAILSGALFGMTLLLALIPLMPSLWLLVAVMVMIGFGTAFQDVGSNTLVVWTFGREAGPYTNALQFAFGLGAFLAPVLADRIFALGEGVRWVYWVQAAMVALVAIWLIRFPAPARRAAPGGADTTSSKGAWKARAVWLTVMIAALLGLHLGAELGFGDWIFSYAVALNVGSDTLARLLNSVYWGAMSIGRLIAIPLAVWMLPRTMLLADLVGAGLSVGLILLLPGWPPALWIGTFGFGLSLASFYASAINFTERRIPITGQVTSYLLVGSVVGEMILPWLIGQLFDSIGPVGLMLTMGVNVVLSLVLLAVTLAYARRFHLGESPAPEEVVGESVPV